jgi:aminoglycoside phosphotransferase (APT) family kinase protein
MLRRLRRVRFRQASQRRYARWRCTQSRTDAGGTRKGVVRVGDTVRRPTGAWTPTIDAFLRHLESVDFPAPRTRGRDDLGRQILTWAPGRTAWDEHARHGGDLERLRKAARLVRRLHDVLDTFQPPEDAIWPGGWGRAEGPRRKPICHMDLAPYNVVASPSGELAVIDWDGAGPGDRKSSAQPPAIRAAGPGSHHVHPPIRSWPPVDLRAPTEARGSTAAMRCTGTP